MMKFALLGKSLAHSISPRIHTEIMNQSGINGSYELIEIGESELEDTLTKLKNENYRGLNVTFPYKELVIPYLDEIDEKAKYIGAVNTISFENGKSKGYNTDYDGFKSLLDHNDISVKDADAYILGSGGAAKAVVKVLLDEGVCDLTIVARNKKDFHNIYNTSFEYIKEHPTNCDILINCTPVGTYPNMEDSPVSLDTLNTKIVIDLIYNPKKTKLMSEAEKRGAFAVNGYKMLVKQAMASQKIWAY